MGTKAMRWRGWWVAAVALTMGCAGPTVQEVRNETVFPQTIQEKTEPAPGSIWSGENKFNMLFADRKARNVNDIVTIIVHESSKGGNNASVNTSRSAGTEAGITSMLGLDTSIIKSNANMGGEISIGGFSENAMKGTGKTSRDGSLQAEITARVTQVLENGNLAIEGRRQLTVNAETQYIVITGVIRSEDITADNLVESQYIADARIVYTGNGVINDKMRPGWLTRVADWAWPF
jgi:Flagellar basal body L-ring protein